MTRRILKLLVIFISGIGLFSSCENDKGLNDGFGTLNLKLTDDPFPIEYISDASVTITKVELRSADDSDENPFTVIFDDTVSYNLLDLRNGIMADLVEIELPVGSYDLIRLYVENASLTIGEFGEFNVKVPSGSQTGIKIFIEPTLRISGGLTSELLLDFNLEKSFVLKGNMNTPAGIKGFNFKPVIRAANMSTSGTVQGIVTDTLATLVPNASVWIESDTVVSSAFSDSTGFYAMPGIPEGTYTLKAAKELFDTLVIDGLQIDAANRTMQNIELVPSGK